MNNFFYLMHTKHWGFPYTMGFPLLYNNNKEEEALPHVHPASPRARELWLPWISKRWFKCVAPLRLATRGHSKDSPTPSTWVGTVVKCCFCPGGPCTATLYPIMAMVRPGGNVYPHCIHSSHTSDTTHTHTHTQYTHWGTVKPLFKATL